MKPNNFLWQRLTHRHVLYQGWHLARADTSRDFIKELWVTDGMACRLDQIIHEIQRKISQGVYEPSSPIRINLPKSETSVRPGTVLSLEDRIVLYSIILLVGRQLDSQLPANVYSFRLKNTKARPQDSLFVETDIYEIPYMKRRKIRQQIDPLQPWYANWPAFDRATRDTLAAHGHRFLATTDIAAYFENIQISLLRDLMFSILPEEPKIVNLVSQFFETWSLPDFMGRPRHRGLPQGSVVSSFFANFFLFDLDREMMAFADQYSSKYYRYVDDIRVFTKDYETAQRALLMLENYLRYFQLNAQTAKTKILDEHKHQISEELVDYRIDQIKNIMSQVNNLQKRGALTYKKRDAYITALWDIAAEEPPHKNGQKLVGHNAKLDGLSLRAFKMWTSTLAYLGSPSYIRPLLNEALKRSDPSLTEKVIRSAKLFPKSRVLQIRLSRFLNERPRIFAHQRAELIGALRYMSCIPGNSVRLCWRLLLSSDTHFYVRMQCAYLLMSESPNHRTLQRLEKVSDSETNVEVKIAMLALTLKSAPRVNRRIVNKIFLHPSPKIASFGRALRLCKADLDYASAKMNFVFSSSDYIIVDQIPYIDSMARSRDPDIRRLLVSHIDSKASRVEIVWLRKYLRATKSNIFHWYGK